MEAATNERQRSLFHSINRRLERLSRDIEATVGQVLDLRLEPVTIAMDPPAAQDFHNSLQTLFTQGGGVSYCVVSCCAVLCWLCHAVSCHPKLCCAALTTTWGRLACLLLLCRVPKVLVLVSDVCNSCMYVGNGSMHSIWMAQKVCLQTLWGCGHAMAAWAASEGHNRSC